MPYNEELARRVRQVLARLPNVEEKKMFRGVTFMVNGKMCISVGKDGLMCRIDPQLQEVVLQKTGSRPVIMRGHIYRGYVYVDAGVLSSKEALDHWINLALEFNPRAKATQKKS